MRLVNGWQPFARLDSKEIRELAYLAFERAFLHLGLHGADDQVLASHSEVVGTDLDPPM